MTRAASKDGTITVSIDGEEVTFTRGTRVAVETPSQRRLRLLRDIPVQTNVTGFEHLRIPLDE